MRDTRAPVPVVIAAVVAMLVPSLAACRGGSREHATTTSSTPAPRNTCARAADATVAVNARIAAARDGSTVSFPAGACFHVDGTIAVVRRHGLTIDGNGATFTRTVARAGRFSPQWLVQLSSRITITGVRISGPKPTSAGFDHDYEGQPGVAIDNSTDVTFEHGAVTDVWGDFFRISNRTDRVRITGNDLTEAGRQGLAVVGGSHIAFDRNVVTRARRFAVDLEPYPSTPVRHVAITDNRFLDPAIGFVCATGYDSRCDRGPALSDVTVERNTQQG